MRVPPQVGHIPAGLIHQQAHLLLLRHEHHPLDHVVGVGIDRHVQAAASIVDDLASDGLPVLVAPEAQACLDHIGGELLVAHGTTLPANFFTMADR